MLFPNTHSAVSRESACGRVGCECCLSDAKYINQSRFSVSFWDPWRGHQALMKEPSIITPLWGIVHLAGDAEQNSNAKSWEQPVGCRWRGKTWCVVSIVRMTLLLFSAVCDLGFACASLTVSSLCQSEASGHSSPLVWSRQPPLRCYSNPMDSWGVLRSHTHSHLFTNNHFHLVCVGSCHLSFIWYLAWELFGGNRLNGTLSNWPRLEQRLGSGLPGLLGGFSESTHLFFFVSSPVLRQPICNHPVFT